MRCAHRERGENGKSAEYTLSLEGQTYPVKLHEIQIATLKRQILHIDFVVTNG